MPAKRRPAPFHPSLPFHDLPAGADAMPRPEKPPAPSSTPAPPVTKPDHPHPWEVKADPSGYVIVDARGVEVALVRGTANTHDFPEGRTLEQAYNTAKGIWQLALKHEKAKAEAEKKAAQDAEEQEANARSRAAQREADHDGGRGEPPRRQQPRQQPRSAKTAFRGRGNGGRGDYQGGGSRYERV